MTHIALLACCVEPSSSFDYLFASIKHHPVLGAIVLFFSIAVAVNIIEAVRKAAPQSDFRPLAGYLILFVGSLAVSSRLGDYLYFFAFLLGMSTALAEIIGKFKDAPVRALRTSQAVWYLAFNGAISSFAIYVLMLAGWSSVTPLERLKLVLAGGLGAMVVMRSKLFSGKVGDQEISFGPEQMVKVYLDFMERDIDRIRAQSRIDFVRQTMEPLKFDEIKEYTLTMLDSAQTLSAEKRKELKDGVGIIGAGNEITRPENKAFSLGFLLSKEMGEDFVRKLFEKPRPEWLSRAVIEEKPSGLVARILGDDSIYYFAFGSSMSSTVMRQRLGWKDEVDRFLQLTSPRAAKLAGFRLSFSLASVEGGPPEVRANVIQDKDSAVEGVVYRLSPKTLDFLDYAQSNSTRRSVKVVTVDDKGNSVEVDAQAYVTATIGESERPTPDYVGWMIQGAREHNLSPEYIASLTTIEVAAPTVVDAKLAAKAS